MGLLNSFDFEGEYVTWTTDGANAGTVFYRNGRFNCTNVCGTMQPKDWRKIDLKFLPYYLNLGTKYSVRLDINPKLMNNMMANIPLVVPPKSEQTAIAAFLDRKTAEIDRLIADKKCLIELYEEEKTAIINQAVTKGLNPDVKMKDSGIEWLREIPEHWEVKRLKYVATINDETLSENTFGDFEIEYIEISDVKSGIGIIEYKRLLFRDAPSRARRVVRLGDVIVSTVRTYLKSIAKIDVFKENLIASTGFAVIRPQTINSHFIGFLFYSEMLIHEIVSLSTGVSYPAINSSQIGDIFIPIPESCEEQLLIANYLESECTRINTKVEKTKKLIALLTEYRTALISEVVTGKIKVT